MVFTEIKDILIQEFGQELVVVEQPQEPMPWLAIQPEKVAEVAEFLHDHEQLYFDFLSCLTGIDNGPEKATMEVVYNLYSIPYGHSFAFKAIVPRNQEGEPLPEVPTVSHIWRSADWHEREIFDLVGISFSEHLDLRRILCAADWQGHPLRKDYQVQEYYHGIKVPYDQHNEKGSANVERQ
ncbi:MAG: NADH-quinone oxidoreductase subunit C [Hymenobacteraceae bacterium]|nr:NADH-quinone oxidoreductase subunit C [Hymenobacteraceae bacterium]MDX5398009.1 NADH-quinone oxidoreductase subunit C [Hymenobacteraceae bacterium]MDX5443549.1 NADH-quinone oxidoreductase subunit C [Hymenobacteraceae bacterium]MDX5514080.1 NADH-quinone oxidoreductase subunit C [Hymenobacteraceae bacterium]